MRALSHSSKVKETSSPRSLDNSKEITHNREGRRALELALITMPRRSERLAAQADDAADAADGIAELSVAESGDSSDRTSRARVGVTTVGKFEILFDQSTGEKPPMSEIEVPTSPPLPLLDIIPYERWAARGYEAQVAQRMVNLQKTIVSSIEKLGSKVDQNERVFSVSIKPLTTISGRDMTYVHPHDRHLLPFFKALSDSLRGYNDKWHDSMHISMSLIRLESSVLKVLEPGLTGLRLTSLSFVGNALEGSTFSLVADVIRQLPTLKAFTMCRNDIGSQKEDVIVRFSDAILGLPKLTSLTLGSVGIDNNKTLLSCVRNKSLQTINLGSNNIGSEGAYFLAKFLANSDSKGRHVTRVALDGNDFNDKDAMLFASALKVNKTLARLDLQRNNISCEGTNVLLKALHDDSSLNALSESNHTCHVEVKDRTGEKRKNNCKSPNIEFINNTRVPKYCGRKSKLVAKMYAPSSDGGSNLRYFEDVPVELMPEVLGMIQYGSFVSTRNQTHALLFDILQSKPLIFVAKTVPKVVVGRKRKAL